ncbi:HupE/UreJ family protein [Ideonella sp. A 288]|uniref:HupE/UreJ family protein n=1 Tax=Ideonella sp. A 288 TaxID=1962181 RepID=UPI000B4ADA94|nr:HupE/UreJ family protein [Ideonella sp. A 288]
MQRTTVRAVALLALPLLPSLAVAHVGAGSTMDFAAGLAHPLYGADHLLAMVAVGAWLAARSVRFARVAGGVIAVAGAMLLAAR